MVSRGAFLSSLLLVCNSARASQEDVSGTNAFLNALFTVSYYEEAKRHEQNDLLSALFKASRTGSISKVMHLIRLGVPVDVPDECHRRTPLMVACEYGHGRVAKVLLSHGARHDATDSRDQKALDYALKFEKNHKVWMSCRRLLPGYVSPVATLLSAVRSKEDACLSRGRSSSETEGYVTLSELNVDEVGSQTPKPVSEYASTLCYPNPMFPYCQGDITH